MKSWDKLEDACTEIRFHLAFNLFLTITCVIRMTENCGIATWWHIWSYIHMNPDIMKHYNDYRYPSNSMRSHHLVIVLDDVITMMMMSSMVCMHGMWHKEHLWNFGVLNRVHIFNLIFKSIHTIVFLLELC
jgi:hypothetical protein